MHQNSLGYELIEYCEQVKIRVLQSQIAPADSFGIHNNLFRVKVCNVKANARHASFITLLTYC